MPPVNQSQFHRFGISATDLRASKTKNCVVKVRLDGTTIRKADLKSTRCKIEFDPPYSLESGSALKVELVQSSRLPTSRSVLTAIEFTVTIAKEILETQEVSQLTVMFIRYIQIMSLPTHLQSSVSVLVCASRSQLRTVNILSAGIARAAELQSVLDHLGKYSKFLQTFLALGLVASEANSIAKAVFDMTDVLACITDVEQFAKSAQLKQAMEEVNPIVRATGNFITKYSTQSLKLPARILSITFGTETREELDKLTSQFRSFRHKFDRGLTVQSGMSIAMMETQLKFLLDSTNARPATAES
ncbi:hypothetical protein B0H14DRAFT_2637698 [Mycena olivaceomarginata]|nr:hypothetical protein B0H14DRAFT_2637698 [Mycena olivaceomarginata]